MFTYWEGDSPWLIATVYTEAILPVRDGGGDGELRTILAVGSQVAGGADAEATARVARGPIAAVTRQAAARAMEAGGTCCGRRAGGGADFKCILRGVGGPVTSHCPRSLTVLAELAVVPPGASAEARHTVTRSVVEAAAVQRAVSPVSPWGALCSESI